MRISYDHARLHWRAVHISGPCHAYLALRLDAQSCETDISILPGKGPQRILEDRLRLWIAEGLARARAEEIEHIWIARAEAVADDSPRPEIYRELALRILRAAAQP